MDVSNANNVRIKAREWYVIGSTYFEYLLICFYSWITFVLNGLKLLASTNSDIGKSERSTDRFIEGANSRMSSSAI